MTLTNQAQDSSAPDTAEPPYSPKHPLYRFPYGPIERSRLDRIARLSTAYGEEKSQREQLQRDVQSLMDEGDEKAAVIERQKAKLSELSRELETALQDRNNWRRQASEKFGTVETAERHYLDGQESVHRKIRVYLSELDRLIEKWGDEQKDGQRPILKVQFTTHDYTDTMCWVLFPLSDDIVKVAET